MRKYYEAYDERYRQVHEQGLQWTGDTPSAIVERTMKAHGIGKDAKLLEIGCGEGRDARFLLERGYDLLATDLSPEAVAHCKAKDPRHAKCYRALDCVRDSLDAKFDFIYAVAVVDMLVEDEDRAEFYRFIREHLTQTGIALVCTMGDGEAERRGDVNAAFALEERVHRPSGKTLTLATLPARMVSFETFEREIVQGGLAVVERGMTAIKPEFDQIMFAVVRAL